MISASEITAAWDGATAQYGFDPIAGDAGAEATLYDRAADGPAIAANIAGLERVRAACPAFFAEFDYAWAFDPSAYRRAIEANMQVRVLQHLAMMHRSPHRPSALPCQDVVARYTFQTAAEPCTPFHAPVRGFHFIVSPFSFHEHVLLLTRAFIDSVAGSEAGWPALRSFSEFREGASGFLRQVFLRALTDAAFHPGLPGEPPMDAVKRASAWFSEATEDGEIDEATETPLTCSLIDFALAHELGHVLHAHAGLAREPDLRLQSEQDADFMGFALYNTSWGWRDDIIDGCPLGQGARILLGPLMFHLFIKWHLALRQGLAVARIQHGGLAAAAKLPDALTADVAESSQRSQAAFRQVAHYEAMIRERGAVFTDADDALFQGVAKAGAAFTLHIIERAATIPADDFNIAQQAGAAWFET